MIKNKNFVLANGVEIPKVGYGTWQIRDREECINGTIWALNAGYRHIDTAAAYGNEMFIREALEKGKFKREDVFITSKLPATKKGYDVTLEEFDQTIKNLGVDYLDLYLIHAPKPWGDTTGKDFMPDNIESWKAMEKLYKEGKIKAIGVSNFSIEELKRLIAATEIKPMVNQIHLHIGSPNKELSEFCKKEGILVEAYSPLATGKIFTNEDIAAMAKKYKVSVAQLCIRWVIQKDMLPLPKSVHEGRIKENIDIDFEISKEDMEFLSNL
jgi:diketogulonate reductase-like aldo/keto reductase